MIVCAENVQEIWDNALQLDIVEKQNQLLCEGGILN